MYINQLDTKKSNNIGYVGRFAPTPTGALHLGSVVTAVASYIRAKQNKGKWLLRIDDLDKKRERNGSRDLILRGISSLGLEWDGLSSQGDNLVDYRQSMNFLAEKGLTYNCACSRKKLPKGPYLGTCREKKLSPDENRSIRVKTPDTTISFCDSVFGKIQGNVFSEMGDFVIKPRDEVAAYQLAVVIDDAKSEITEVVRGADLLRSTLMQLCLYRTLQLTPPLFMHIPVVRDSRNIKLSKRSGAKPVDINDSQSALKFALDYLGFELPSHLEKASCRELLVWAIQSPETSFLKTVQSRFSTEVKNVFSSL